MPNSQFLSALRVLILASAISLGGCAWLFYDPDDQPAFEVRNAFDKIVEPYIGLRGVDYFDKELPLRTLPLLRETFPPGTSFDYVSGYFERIGGGCHKGSVTNGVAICEYCTLKVERAASYFSIYTLRREILWHIELFDQSPPASDPPQAMMVQAISLRVLEGGWNASDSEDSDTAPSHDCASARSRLPSSPVPFRTGKWWVYGKPEPTD